MVVCLLNLGERDTHFARYTAQATAGDKICLANLLKQPEREKIMHYSIAMGLGLPQRLIMKQEIAQSLGIIGTTELSLIELFKNPNLKANFEKGRAYQNLDPIIQEGSSKYKNVGINVILSDRSFRMMQLDRISYIVEYPYQANLMAKKLSLQIITFKIKEHVPFIEAFVTCAKTDFGLQVINKVSQFIRANKATPEYRKMTTSLSKYLDENTFTSLMDLRETVFIKMDK